MNKMIAGIVAVLILTVSGIALAEMEKGKEKMKCGMMDKGGMMMKMMEKSVVATSDGGVVIVSMNKITKYDKDLKLVKEVELKMQEMGDMKKMCPMMGKGNMDNDDDDAAEKVAEKSEHKSHH
jgi:hypothetical protein